MKINFKVARLLSLAFLGTASLFLFVGYYLFFEIRFVFYLFVAIAISLYVCSFVVIIVFNRCPYCRKTLPTKGGFPKFCNRCGRRLD